MNTKKMGLYEKVINIILDIFIFLFGLILLISLYKGIQVKILGNKYSSFFGYATFEVQTGSMRPTIEAGDWIIVKVTDDIKIGDIVTYSKNDEFITHTVIESYKGTYITKGDANNTKDEPITKDQIVGKVTKTLKHFGIFRKTLFNPYVLITLIITLYVIGYVVRKNKEDNSKGKFDEFVNNFIEKMQAKKKEKVTKEKVVKEKVIKEEKKEEKKVEPIVEEVKYEQVNETHDEVATKEDLDLAPLSEEDLDKTMYFRAVSVDASELDETYLKIKENQNVIEEAEAKEEEKKRKLKEREEEARRIREEANIPVDESLIKESLEMLKKKAKRKFKNIIEKSMYIKEQELSEIVDILNGNEKKLTNEATIKNELTKAYIDVKYYNFCGNYNAEYTSKNMTVKIVDTIKDLAEKMIKDYKGSDTAYNDKVMKYTNIFILIMYLEQVDGNIEDVEPIREMFKKKITKYFKNQNISDEDVNNMITSIIKVQKKYQSMIRYSLKQMDTKTFSLEFNQLTTKKNLYGLILAHNIEFSKVYSEYIVDKTYSEGIIAEDKTMIMATLLSTKIVEDMLASDFKKKYLMYIPKTLYTKENKLKQLLDLTNDEYIKNVVINLIDYKTLIENKKMVKDLVKEGYKFGIIFTDDDTIKAKDQAIINVAEYIFIGKKKTSAAELVAMIPAPARVNIVFENIISKVEYPVAGGE